ncbi:MAG: rRNA pseudouridine synthase [Anaerolactibacter massiliensis]|nr:rRNA pseudouridine synthase [Anaerolactibacter massiliensis]
MRLDKVLADLGIGTRKELKQLIRSGRVNVNGETVSDPGMHVDPEQDELFLDGQQLAYEKYVYFMLNKPQGIVSATRDASETVLDLLDEPYKDLFPCGRLDKDTEGLLLITNDGPLAHQLLSPKHHIEKEYLVTIRHPLSDQDIRRIEDGMTLQSGEVFQPAHVIPVSDTQIRLILKEGKYHEIKRMLLAVGNEVTALKRLRMKNLVLDETLGPGEYRRLTEEELQSLRAPEDFTSSTPVSQ